MYLSSQVSKLSRAREPGHDTNKYHIITFCNVTTVSDDSAYCSAVLVSNFLQELRQQIPCAIVRVYLAQHHRLRGGPLRSMRTDTNQLANVS